jgi:predicted nucleic acid-binding protein
LEKIVIADTDVIIDYFSGIEPLASAIEQLIIQDSLALTSITVFELYAGVTGKKRIKQIDALTVILPVFPFEEKHAGATAEIYNDLKKTGNLIGNQDILIAGICIAHDIPIFTRNTAHFSRIPGLRIFSF